MTTLGERLKKQNEARAAADLAIRNAKTAAELQKAQEEQAAVVAFFEKIKREIEERVEANLPLTNWRLPKGDAFYVSWDGSTMSNDWCAVPRGFKYLTAAGEFFKWCSNNYLRAKFVANHDGVGMDSWFEIHVEPMS